MRTRIGKAGALSLVAAALALSGCGGGGGGGGGGGAGSPVIGGVASKGLMQNALVTAYCGPMTAGVVVGTAYTDVNGTYSLTLTAACSQPVEVVVGVNPSPTTQHPATTMLDEVQGTITPPANFVLRAFVPSASGTISQPVTPLTDMAAAVALNAVSNNTLTATAVGNANLAIINTVLGGNSAVFNAIPVAPAQYSAAGTSSAQQQLAVVLAAISAAAQQNGGNPSAIQSTVQAMSSAAEHSVAVTAGGYTVNGTQPGTTPIDTIASGLTALSGGQVSLNTSGSGAPSSAVAQAIVSPGNISGLQTSIVQTSQNQIAAGGSVTVAAASTSVATAIASAKALIQAIRTDLIGLGNSANTGYLQTQSTSMASDMTSAGSLLGYEFGKQLTAIQQTLLFAADVSLTPNVFSSTPGTAGTATTLTTGEKLVTTGGQVPVFGKYYERTFGTSGTADYMQCRAFVTGGTGVTSTVGTLNRAPLLNSGEYLATVCTFYPYPTDLSKQVHFAVHQTTTSLASATLTYGNLLRTYPTALLCNYYQASCAATDSPAGPFNTTGHISMAINTVTVNQNTFQALTQFSLPTGSQLISLDGNNPTVFALNAQLVPAAQTSTSSQYTFNISGSIATAAANPGASAQINSGSYVQVDTTSGVANVNLAGSLQTTAFKYDGTFTGSATGANAANNAAPTPTAFAFTGNVSTLSGGVATPFLSISRLTADTSTKTAALTGTVIKNGAQTQISGTVDASAADHLSSTMSFIIPGYTFTASGVSYPNLSAPSTMTVTSSDGTVILLTRDTANVTSTVVRDKANELLGTIIGNNQLNFVDGSYVILN